jgi:methionyl aminopeptidase
MAKAVKIKTPEEISIMAEGGRIMGEVKSALLEMIKEGVSAYEIDKLAEDLIIKKKAKPSFKMVNGYYWTTCININEGLVHGIPKKELIIKKGDLVSVDVGVFYKGFHTDSSFSLGVSADDAVNKFLDIGKKALQNAIKQAIAGNYVFDISSTIEKTLKGGQVNPIIDLVGHGVGRELHEEPSIPCYARGMKELTHKITNGNVFAIEIMYTKGSGEIKLENDQWTISTKDDKISALFEDTVAVTESGPSVLTGFQS